MSVKALKENVEESLNKLKESINERFDLFDKQLESTNKTIEENIVSTNDLKISINEQFSEFTKQLQDTTKSLLETNEINSTEIKGSFKTFEDSIRNDLLHIRKVHVAKLANENRDLRTRVRSLEQRMVKLERQTNQNEQNNRKNNVELKPLVAKIIDHITDNKFDVNDIDVEACHRLPGKDKPKRTIVRMKRNILDEAMKNKAKLKDIAHALNMPRTTKIFINPNQSPNMKSLAFNARLLKNYGLIEDTWFNNAAVRIKCLDGAYIKVTHEMDLFENFPNFQHFTFDAEFLNRAHDVDLELHSDLVGAWDNFFDVDKVQEICSKLHGKSE